MEHKMLKAKLEALQDLIKEMDSMEDSEYDSLDEMVKPQKLQKVTVMAPDKKGLEKGLSKAEELLGQFKEEEGSEPKEEEKEESEEEEEEKEEESKEEQRDKLKKLLGR